MLTMKLLKKRGFQLASRFLLCGKAEEELNHTAPSVLGLWEGLISIPGIDLVCP